MFLGMGFGPLIAGGLSKINFSIGLVSVDEFTVPGWFFCAVWLLMAFGLALIPEPERIFTTELLNNVASARARSDDSSKSVPKVDAKIVWCLLVLLLSCCIVAAWETSAAIVTQKVFGWSVWVSSLFIGAVFLSSFLGGEAIKSLMQCRTICEANVIVAGLATTVAGSVLLYWYIPATTAKWFAVSNTVAYVVGSCIVMNASNATRTYSTAVAMRAGASVNLSTKELVTIVQALVMMVGRSGGALCGMGLASMPDGTSTSAGIITVLAIAGLVFLLAPGLLNDLRGV